MARGRVRVVVGPKVLGLTVLGLTVLGLLGGCGDGSTPERLARAVPPSTEAAPDGLSTAATAAATTSPASTTTSSVSAATVAVTPPPETTAPPQTTAPPETTAPPQTTAPPETTTTAAPVDLQSVDWANRTYTLRCPGEADEVTLVDGEYRGSSFMYSLRDVLYGQMGTPPRPVAVLRLLCIGAGNFPMLVLVFDGSGPQEQFLGDVAGYLVVRDRPGQHSWQADGPLTLEGGVLTMVGRGWSGMAPHCCPNLEVVSRVVLADDGTLQEIEHLETPRTTGTVPG